MIKASYSKLPKKMHYFLNVTAIFKNYFLALLNPTVVFSTFPIIKPRPLSVLRFYWPHQAAEASRWKLRLTLSQGVRSKSLNPDQNLDSHWGSLAPREAKLEWMRVVREREDQRSDSSRKPETLSKFQSLVVLHFFVPVLLQRRSAPHQEVSPLIQGGSGESNQWLPSARKSNFGEVSLRTTCSVQLSVAEHEPLLKSIDEIHHLWLLLNRRDGWRRGHAAGLAEAHPSCQAPIQRVFTQFMPSMTTTVRL